MDKVLPEPAAGKGGPMQPLLPATGPESKAPSSATMTRNETIWAEAFAQLSKRLTRKDVTQIRATTFETFSKHILKEQRMYKDQTIPQILEKLDPFFNRLRVLNSAIDTYAQTSEVMCLVWGSLKIVLELASRFKDIIERIGTMLEDINHQLPRFELYLESFPEHTRIDSALLRLYKCIVSFQIDCILFLRKNPIRALIQAGWSTLDEVFRRSLSGIRDCCESLNLEAFAANIISDKSRHEEIKSLLLSNQSSVRQEVEVTIPCHIMEFPRNPLFSGRSSMLQCLRDHLVLKKETEQASVAVVGLGGIGKTQLANEFTWENKDSFDVILWAQADSVAKLENGLLKLARALCMPHSDGAGNITQVIEAVVQWLSSPASNYSWLLVFDNVDDGKILQNFWPVCERGSILVTAKNTQASFTPALKSLHVPPLTNDEGRDLVLRTLTNHSPQGLHGDMAIQLSATLGGMPLALAQVSGYISTVNYTMQEFLELYREESLNGNEIIFSLEATDCNYDLTLSTVWTMTMARLGSNAVSLLRVLAFFDPDNIPEYLISGSDTRERKSGLDVLDSKVRYLEALGQLRTYDLIQRDATRKSLSIHRLVQGSVRDRMSASERLEAFWFAVHVLSIVYPRQVLGMAMDKFWNKCETLLPQVQAVIWHSEYFLSTGSLSNSSLGSQDTSAMLLLELLHNATWFMQERGMFELLLPIVDVGRRILEELGHSKSMMMGELYNTLGNVHLEIGNHQECKDYFLRVKAIREIYHAPGEPVMANISNNLSLAETALGNYETAVELSKKVIKIREGLDDAEFKVYKENTLPINMANLCRILWVMDRLSNAAEVGEQAVSLAQESFGLNSKNTAQAIYNLADVRMKQGHESALKLHLHALYLRRNILGSHYQTAGSCYKVACLLLKQGDALSAKELLKETVTMYSESFSANSGLARTWFKLSTVLEVLRETQGAKDASVEALTLVKAMKVACPDALYSESFFDSLVPYTDR